MRKGAASGLVVLSLCALAPLQAQAASSTPISFAKPIVAIPMPSTGESRSPISEPHLAVGRDGRIYVSASFQQWDCATGKPSGTLADCTWASDDERSFQASGGVAADAGDNTDLAVTASGRVLESAMANIGLGSGVGGATVATSSDGHAWSQAQDVNHEAASDRPYLLPADSKNVVLTYAALPGGIWAVRSHDDGTTFGLPAPIALGTLDVNGSPTYDRARGELVVPYSTSTLPTCNSGFNGCFNILHVARSHDGGASWTTSTVATFPAGTGMVGPPIAKSDAIGDEFITISTAQYGTLGQVSPVGPAHVWLLRMPLGSKTWSSLLPIDHGSDSAELPAITVSGTNCVAALYYRSASSNAEQTPARWDVVIAISSDGGAHFRDWTVQRDVYDGAGQDRVPVFIDQNDIATDRAGHLVAAWTDTHHDPSGAHNSIDFVRQSTGPALSSCRG